MKRKLIAAGAVLALGFMCVAFTLKQQPKPWNVPAKNAKAVNPVKTSPESIAESKSLWIKHCQSCHGKQGLGDGTKAAQLKTEPGDFSKTVVQSQPDGALFYKISEGRDDMPSFKKKIPDQEDIWGLVNFIRTLKK